MKYVFNILYFYFYFIILIGSPMHRDEQVLLQCKKLTKHWKLKSWKRIKHLFPASKTECFCSVHFDMMGKIQATHTHTHFAVQTCTHATAPLSPPSRPTGDVTDVVMVTCEGALHPSSLPHFQSFLDIHQLMSVIIMLEAQEGEKWQTISTSESPSSSSSSSLSGRGFTRCGVLYRLAKGGDFYRHTFL